MKFFIPVVLLAVLCSCGKPKAGIVLSSTPIFGSESSNDTIHIAPTGAVLAYQGDPDQAKGRMKVKFNGNDGFIEKEKFIFRRECDGRSRLVWRICCLRQLSNGNAYIHKYDMAGSSWVDVNTLDKDTANITVAALANAIDNSPYNDELNISLAKIAAGHSTHPRLQTVKVDLSEVPDESIIEMQKKFHLLINKSTNEIITTRNTTTGWINSCISDIFKISRDADQAEISNSTI
ncbi:MAG: hypothetical protein WDO15_03960 [Bacteroidota bacterium]